MNGKREAYRISAYRVAVIMPVKITIEVAPLLEIPAHTWTFKGCLCLYFSFRGAPLFRKLFRRGLISENHVRKLFIV